MHRTTSPNLVLFDTNFGRVRLVLKLPRPDADPSFDVFQECLNRPCGDGSSRVCPRRNFQRVRGVSRAGRAECAPVPGKGVARPSAPETVRSAHPSAAGQHAGDLPALRRSSPRGPLPLRRPPRPPPPSRRPLRQLPQPEGRPLQDSVAVLPATLAVHARVFASPRQVSRPDCIWFGCASAVRQTLTRSGSEVRGGLTLRRKGAKKTQDDYSAAAPRG
jgi:hypothetical protein